MNTHNTPKSACVKYAYTTNKQKIRDNMGKIKCELKKNGLFNWCNAMRQRLEPLANEGYKGLIQINLSNFKTRNTTCLGIKYKLNAKDKGLLLNKCPWCGEKIINGHLMKREAQDKRIYTFVKNYKPTELL